MRELFVLLTVLTVATALLDQSIAIRGKLLCGAKPAANVRVKLWEEDTGSLKNQLFLINLFL
ncbi:unnamed protein product [Gongylonema pulchrum]|uniref:Transthyretin-like family protein n=1 Tax=Gongylonema pulchrum TaxID=637853 RepID=A0A183F0Z7_9BILA|nr:unnamed protein product [Gongylonema pulchrum]